MERWGLGDGTAGSGAITPSPFELWEFLSATAVAPQAVLDVPDMHVYLSPDSTDLRQMNLSNVGTCPLEWVMFEAPEGYTMEKAISYTAFRPKTLPADISGLQLSVPGSGAPAAPASPEAVLWDQPTSNTGGVVAQYFSDFGTGVYSTDDFEVDETSIITSH